MESGEDLRSEGEGPSVCRGDGVKTGEDKNHEGRKEECFTQTRLHLLTAGFLQHETRDLHRISDFYSWCLFSFPDRSDGQQELRIDHFSCYSGGNLAVCALNPTCNDASK